MPNFLDRAKAVTATTGTGTVTLGAAVSSFQSWATAGAVNGAVYSYLIEDGTAWEIGRGVYTTSGTTLSRTLVSSSTGSLLNLNTGAFVSQIAATHDLRFMGCRVKKAADQTAANYTAVTAVTWDSEDFDTDGFHESVTNPSRITIPASLGINYVELQTAIRIDLLAADVFINAFIRKNGGAGITDVPGSLTTESGNTSGRIIVNSGPLPVTAGDYFEVMLLIETDTSVTLPTHIGTYFSLRVVG